MSESDDSKNVLGRVGRAVNDTVSHVGQKLTRGTHIPLLKLPRFRKPSPGAPPGLHRHDLDKLESGPEPVEVTCIDYCPQWVKRKTVDDVDRFIAEHRPPGTQVRWINVAGLSDIDVIKKLATKYGLHPLAVEDMLNIPQRAKVEPYVASDEHQAELFIIAQVIRSEEGTASSEQVSIFLGHGTVLTFQQHHGDVWDPIRDRIEREGSRLRNNDPSYLVYALLDAIVDHCFPIIELYSVRLEELEEQVIEGTNRHVVQDIYTMKRELLLLGKQVWSTREMINSLQREEHECLSEFTRVYLRDVYDHAIQLLEMLEAYRELAGGLADTHMTVVGNRMNEVMKVLTIFATIFIPITFVAGVYGMNFEHIPELHWKWAYAAFWTVCVSVAGGMLWWFWRKGWYGRK